MRTSFVLDADTLRAAPADTATITVFSAPTADERRALVNVTGIDRHTLASVLDPEETARLELDTSRTTIIWKAPEPRDELGTTRFAVASVGIILGPGCVTVVDDNRTPLAAGDHTPTPSLAGVVLRIMQVTVDEFQVGLRTIRRTSADIQARLSQTIDNRELVRMFDLAEDLVYYVDAIEANGAVMTRLRGVAERLGFTPAEVAVLDDLMIDNAQSARQGRLYSTVLAGLLDARGNIVNNNMNVLIKNLTVVNVVFLPLGVIASMGGMSEFSMMLDDHATDWRIGYPLFALTIALIGLGLWRVIGHWIDRQMTGSPQHTPVRASTAQPGEPMTHDHQAIGRALAGSSAFSTRRHTL